MNHDTLWQEVFNLEKRIQRGYVVSASLMTRYSVKGLIMVLIFIMAIILYHE